MGIAITDNNHNENNNNNKTNTITIRTITIGKNTPKPKISGPNLNVLRAFFLGFCSKTYQIWGPTGSLVAEQFALKMVRVNVEQVVFKVPQLLI